MAEEMRDLRLQRKLTGIRMRRLRIGERRLEAMAEEVRQQMQALRSLRQPGIRIRRLRTGERRLEAMREEVRQEMHGLRQEVHQTRVVHDEIQEVRDQIQVVQGVRDEIQQVREAIEAVRQQLEEAGQEIQEDGPEIEHGPNNLQETMEELNGNLERLQEIQNNGEDILEGAIREWIVKLIALRQIQMNRQDIQIQVDDQFEVLRENIRLNAENENLMRTNHELAQELDIAVARGGTGLGMLPVMYFVYACFSLLLAGGLIFLTISDFGPSEQPGTLIDAFYVASCIILSIGFGDITPLRPLAMFLCDGLALFGPVIVLILTYFLSRYAFDLERRVMSHVEGSSRMVYRVCAALVMIFLTIFLGMIGIYISEWIPLSDRSPSLSPSLSPSSCPSPSPPGMLPVDTSSWGLFVDIFHLSVMMMTTTGFGDFAFTTPSGRVFAILWMPLCTTLFVVASAFLAETFLVYVTRPSTRDYRLLDMTDRD